MFHLVFAETPFTDNIQADERPIVRVKNFKASFTPVLNNRLLAVMSTFFGLCLKAHSA